ncbi:MAG: hypothetical protein A3H28_07135 [Acidobacteria bacterium RIFCSPLOWO2_02_FULL_61_28]|nr:MAG: hypothetical protein A3H28_07135 [Acidobacteria bacterium RIFCSPLOWO2_02_FULL_61_28]
MATLSLDLFSSILSFLGGAILSIDALRVKRSIGEESSAKHFLEILEKIPGSVGLRDKHGKSLNTERALQLWLSERSFQWAWLGFVLMTAGFFLEILTK